MLWRNDRVRFKDDPRFEGTVVSIVSGSNPILYEVVWDVNRGASSGTPYYRNQPILLERKSG